MALDPNPLLETHPRVSPTWKSQGSVYASELEGFCIEHELAFSDFVQISLSDRDVRLFGYLFGEYVN